MKPYIYCLLNFRSLKIGLPLIRAYLLRNRLLIIAVLLYALGMSYIEFFDSYTTLTKSNYWPLTFLSNIPQLFMVAAGLFLCRKQIFWNNKSLNLRFKIFVVTSGIILSSIFFSTVKHFYPTKGIYYQEIQRSRDILSSMRSENFFVDFIPKVISAPISEEAFFRHGLLSFAINPLGRFLSLGGSSLLFAYVHKRVMNYPYLFVVFLVGLMLGTIYYKLGLLWSMIAHALINFCFWAAQIESTFLDLILTLIFLSWFSLSIYYSVVLFRTCIKLLRDRFPDRLLGDKS